MLDKKIVYNNDFKDSVLVLPRSQKYQETTIDANYYDLLRIFSNQLEKENTVLFVYGFSFSDLHIQTIVRRALARPTLTMVVFSYDSLAGKEYEKIFKDFQNVLIIIPEVLDAIGFDILNILLSDI